MLKVCILVDEGGMRAFSHSLFCSISMNLTELKKKPIAELVQIADLVHLDNMARNRKQRCHFLLF